MKTWNSLMIIGAVAVGSLVAFNANAVIHYGYDTPNTTVGNVGGGWNLGEEFIPNQALTVTSLGAFDSGANGWGGDTVYVAIYNVTTHNQVGSMATFSDAGIQGTLAYPGSSYRYQNVTPFQLTAGQTYEIVAGAANTSFYSSLGAATSIIMDNSGMLTYGDGVGGTGNFYSGWTGSLAFPGNADGGPLGRYGAGSFTVVPEATTFGAAGVGLLALVYLGRCARLRRGMKVA